MFRPYLLGAVGLAAAASGALLCMVATQADGAVNSAQAVAVVDQRPVDSSATYREQMKLTQETLRSFGYAPGDINGIMRFETASALRAFQRRYRVRKIDGVLDAETLALLGELARMRP